MKNTPLLRSSGGKLLWLCKTSLALCCFAWVLPSCSSPEPSKALVKISEVQLSRPNDQTLRVRFEYDVEQDVTLPLPYPEVLVFPLEPEVKLAGSLKPLTLYTDWLDVSLSVPAEAGIDWDALSDPETCCTVSLKGALATGDYERISNAVTVRLAPPPSQGTAAASDETSS